MTSEAKEVSGSSTSARQVFEQIEAAVMSGRYRPRQRLVERHLEKEYGCSRTPIREALKLLEYAGLVQTEPNRGAMVRDFEVEDVYALYLVRLPLEKLAIEMMPRARAAELAMLARIEDGLESAFAEGNFPTMVKCNEEFHAAFASLARNEWLFSSLEHLRRQTFSLVQHGPFTEVAGREGAIHDHRRIIALLRRDDRAALIKLTFDHVLRAARLYLRRAGMLAGKPGWYEALDEFADAMLRSPVLTIRRPDMEPREHAENRPIPSGKARA